MLLSKWYNTGLEYRREIMARGMPVVNEKRREADCVCESAKSIIG